MLAFCRYRSWHQSSTPECHNLTCPWCGQKVSAEQCANCTFQHPDDQALEHVVASPVSLAAPTGPSGPTGPTGPNATLRPDLTVIERTLPPPDGEERTFQRPVFGPDGTIRYPKRDGDWEPPQEPNGYRRDPNNPWHFLPLWPVCGLRLAQGFIKVACGCLGINMRCNQPKASTFGQQIAHTDCEKCPHRS